MAARRSTECDRPATPVVPWHAISIEEVLSTLNTSSVGLSKGEAATRLEKYGPNQLTPAKTRTIWRLIWEQTNNIIIYILLMSGIIKAAYHDWIEMGLILGVIVVNVAIGVLQEGKAEKATAAIRAMTKASALALRNGKRVQLDAASLVPGDVIFLAAGDRIPADIRWLDCSSVQVTEAMLTGESAPVTKTPEPVEGDAPLGDRTCLGYTGTLVFTGQGSGVVVATGDSAEIGALNKLMTRTELAKTPLLVQIERFGRGLSLLCILVAIATFFIAFFGRGLPVEDALSVAVGVAVALIPEGLPTVVTITLAIGVQAMARQRAIIRQLPAVETLGSVTVICSDKTGTLTKNEMTAVGVHTAGGAFRTTGTGYHPDGDVKRGEDPIPPAQRAALRQLLLPAVLCNDSTLMPTVSAVAQAMLGSQAIVVPVPQEVQPSPPTAGVGPSPVSYPALALTSSAAGAASNALGGAPTPITLPAAATPGDDVEDSGDVTSDVEAGAGAGTAALKHRHSVRLSATLSGGIVAAMTTQEASLHIVGVPDAPVKVEGDKTPSAATSSADVTPSAAGSDNVVVAVGPAGGASSSSSASNNEALLPSSASSSAGAAGASSSEPANSDAVDSAIAKALGATARRIEWNTTGDPTEAALLALGMKAGLNLRTINALTLACPRIDTIPFSSDTKFMATAHELLLPPPAAVASLHEGSGDGDRSRATSVSAVTTATTATAAAGDPVAREEQVDGGKLLTSDVPPSSSQQQQPKQLTLQRVLLVKGAPDVLLPRCATQAPAAALMGGGDVIGDPWAAEPLQLARWLKTAADLSKEGLRVLALCSMRVPPTQVAFSSADVTHGPPRLHLHCLVSIVDPPRDEAVSAIKQAHGAGITVKMITGDHADTARTIGGWIGIESESVLTGSQVAAMDDEALSAHVEDCNIYARMSPEQKLRIVRALYKHGHVVAMTGDGVNDAPALKAASVGVAMGITGTEVAKEAAKMILMDDNFATIVSAVRQGRGVFDNLRKLMMFILPTSVAQGLGLTAAMIIDVPPPLTIIQLLYVNIVTAISLGLVLAVEEPEPSVMGRPPRRQSKPLVGKLVAWRAVFIGLLLIIAMLGNQQWTLAMGGTKQEGHTMALNTLVVSQCLYCLACRFISHTSLSLSAIVGNPWLTSMIVLTGALQCLITYTPGVQDVFDTAHIGGLEWLRILAFALVIFLIVEAEKWLKPAQYFIPPLRRAWAATAARVQLPACCCRRKGGASSPQPRLYGQPPSSSSTSASVSHST